MPNVFNVRINTQKREMNPISKRGCLAVMLVEIHTTHDGKLEK